MIKYILLKNVMMNLGLTVLLLLSVFESHGQGAYIKVIDYDVKNVELPEFRVHIYDYPVFSNIEYFGDDSIKYMLSKKFIHDFIISKVSPNDTSCEAIVELGFKKNGFIDYFNVITESLHNCEIDLDDVSKSVLLSRFPSLNPGRSEGRVPYYLLIIPLYFDLYLDRDASN